jgi:hypothetical protein
VSETTTGDLRWHWETPYQFTTAPDGQVTARLDGREPDQMITTIRKEPSHA